MGSELQMQGFSGIHMALSTSIHQHLSTAPPFSHRDFWFCPSTVLLGGVKEKSSVCSPNFLHTERRELLVFLFSHLNLQISEAKPSLSGWRRYSRKRRKSIPFLAVTFAFLCYDFHTLSWAFLYIHIPAVTIVAVISKLPVRKEEVPMTFSVPLDAKTMVWKAASLHVGGTKDEE